MLGRNLVCLVVLLWQAPDLMLKILRMDALGKLRWSSELPVDGMAEGVGGLDVLLWQTPG